jgi:hypothetical protein
VKEESKKSLNIRVDGKSELYVLEELVYAGPDPVESVQVYSAHSSPEWFQQSERADGIGLILLINGRYIRAFTDSGRIGRVTYDKATHMLSMNFDARDKTGWEAIRRQIAAFRARPLHVRQKMGYGGADGASHS